MVIGVSKHANVGDATTPIAGHVLTQLINRVGHQDVPRVAIEAARILGGHVDIERRQVL